MKSIVACLLGIWIGAGFAANYAWEMLQMPLYVGVRGAWLRCASAAVADVAVLGFLYAVMSAAAGTWLWFREAAAPRMTALAVVGSLAATAIELQALAIRKWSYDAMMPLVPFFGVGVSPVLQMLVIPLGLAWLSRKALRTAP